MKYESVSLAQVLLSDGQQELYMLTKVTGDLTLDELRNARGFAAEIPDEAEAVASETPASRLIFTEIPAKKTKAAVDHGKIISLDNAGWSVTQIAREIGCSEQTVRNHIAKEVSNGSEDN